VPELPEVETVRRGLLEAMEGRRFDAVELRRPDLRFPFPERFADRLEGRRLERLERRAKYLIGHINDGQALIMHLGMTGRFTVTKTARAKSRRIGEFAHDHGADTKHDHVVFRMSGGATVTYNDARRFGFMLLTDPGELASHALIRGIGIEPLGDDLDAAFLARRARGRKTDMKAFLMDQRIIAGLGNIYVCEALWRAHVSPTARAGKLARSNGEPVAAAERLVVAIKDVLNAAILAGGSTLRDYKNADGGLGYFQHAFDAYGRSGEACRTEGCDGLIRRKVQAGRSTFYCPKCQR
jgi:formamidopyrimidine-DNA glycosylase